MQLTIGIDYTSAARERAGIGRYARELIRALAHLDSINRYILFVPRDAHDDLLRFSQISPVWPPNFAIRRAPFAERLVAALWHRGQVPLPVELFTGPVDVFYSPDFLLPPTWARRTLVTVHDLSYIRLPESFPEVLRNYLNAAVPRALRRADLILADAASTAHDLDQVYRLPPDKIRVLYSGVDGRFCTHIPAEEQARVRQKYDLRDPYLLSVSTLQPRKNYARLIEAFAQLAAHSEQSAPDLKLVIAGGKGWMYEDVYQAVERLGLQNQVVFTGFTPDEDLPALYAAATLFVYPSLYEGFGLGIAEAMACGIPVVSSKASSLPEVGGNAALYFNPYDIDEMASVIRRALADESLRKELQAKGSVQVRRFTWEKAAGELLGYFTES